MLGIAMQPVTLLILAMQLGAFEVNPVEVAYIYVTSQESYLRLLIWR